VVSGSWSWGDEDQLPAWLPWTRTVSLPCGLYFEAVRVPAQWARDAHAVLGPDSGGVLANQLSGTWIFLPDTWTLHGTRLVRRGTAVEVPPAFVVSGRDVHWAALPGRGTTTPQALATALTLRPSATSALTGPQSGTHV
jgi:hypothetical protein